MTDRDDAIELARRYLDSTSAFRDSGALKVSRVFLSEVERSAKLLKALKEIDVQTRWRIEKRHVNFCSDECHLECGDHTATQEYGEK